MTTDTLSPDTDTPQETDDAVHVGEAFWLCTLLRDLRHAESLSLAEIERRHGIPAVVLGAYERGDRMPPIIKADWILRTVYRHELRAVPMGADATRLSRHIVEDLRAIADKLEEKHATSRPSSVS